MATTTANAGPRLTPLFPNEITDRILLHLSFQRLLNGYFASPAWQRFIENEDELRMRMFRLPKRLTAASATVREKFVDDLWHEIYLKPNDALGRSRPWDFIEINPIYNVQGWLTHEGAHVIYPKAPSDLENAFDDKVLPNVPISQQGELERLWRSMFITYPPITRIEYFYKKPIKITIKVAVERWRDMIVDLAGITIDNFRNHTVEAGTGWFYLRALLWPEKAYQESQEEE